MAQAISPTARAVSASRRGEPRSGEGDSRASHQAAHLLSFSMGGLTRAFQLRVRVKAPRCFGWNTGVVKDDRKHGPR
jgi:hypothetical protein